MNERMVLKALQEISMQKNLKKSIEKELRAVDEIAEPKAVDTQNCRISGGKIEDVSRTLEKIQERKRKLTRNLHLQLDRIMRAEIKALNLLNLCSSPEAKSVLMDRYILGQDWESICKNHHYSRARIFQLRRIGIRQIAESRRRTKKK